MSWGVPVWHRPGLGKVTRPWLLRRVVNLLSKDLHLVPWQHVTVNDGELHLDVNVDELEQLEADR